VHAAAIIGLRNQHLQPEAVLQPVAVERLLHGEGGAEQAHLADACLQDRRGGRVGDMQQQRASGFDPIGQRVHGVGADHQQLGATGLQPPCASTMWSPSSPSRRRAAAA
jgi:hypothetical protein